jgi:ATP-dependent Clp protease ATP-binding subunit ClpC
VLLDEIEKAHPDVFNMLLQIMEEGRLTDSFGRHVDFKNIILIMTSNIGAERIMSQDPFGFMKRDEEVNYEKMKEMLMAELERHFRPEFINRLDEVVVFHKLTHADLLRILDLELAKVNARLKEHGLQLELTDKAREYLLEKGTDEKFGARPLKRTLSSMVEDPLSEDILRNKYAGKNVVRVGIQTGPGADDRKLIFEGETVPEEQPAKAEPAVAGANETT